jgi:DNA recombination protein RmuC
MQQAVLIGAIVLLFIINLVLLLLLLSKRSGSIDMGPALERIGKRLDQLGDLSAGVETLSHLFLVPHARGGLGETLLEELLRSWLPSKSFSLQYTFRNGYRVDAIVRLGRYLVPIDAKFPLDGIRKSMETSDRGGVVTTEVKRTFLKHVSDISAKYIQPDDGTLQFALMYIPSERVFYHAFVEADSGLLEEAIRSGVVPVSPGSLFLYLQTIAYGLKGFAFTEKQQEVVRHIEQLNNDFKDLVRALSVSGSHLRNLVKSYDEAQKKLNTLDVSIERLDIDKLSEE